MQKPISLSYYDYKQSIVNLTNNSGLPAFLVAEILQDVFTQVLAQKEVELKRDEAMWHKACNEVTNDGAEVNQ